MYRQIMNNEGFRELASILNPAIASHEGETPLLIAMGAVGKALNITIRPPKGKRGVNSPEAVARASGFRIRRITLDEGWWQWDHRAMLGFIETETEKRPVALLSKQGRGYEIFDPVTFQRIPLGGATAKYLSSAAYAFYRPFPDRKLSSLEILKFAFKGRDREIASLVIFGVFTSLLGMVTPQITALLIDYVIPDAKKDLLIQIGVGLFAASMAITLLTMAQSFMTLRLRTVISADTQAAIWDKLLKLEVSFFRQYSSGDLLNRVSAISQIRDLLSGTIMGTVLTSFFSLLNLGLLFYYSSSLAWVALAVALITSIVSVIAGVIIIQKFRPLQELRGQIVSLMVQTLGGITKLRVAGAENRAFMQWAKKYSEQVKLMLSTQRVEDFLALFNTVMPTVTSIALFSLAVLVISQSPGDGGLSTGRFLAFNAAFGTFVGGVTSLSNTVIDILELSVLWERAQPILHAVPEISHQGADPGELSGALKLDKVSFRYGQDLPWVLNELTLEAKPGEFIGITGPSGKGKSTIVRLLLGFEKPTSGMVMYDHRDLATLDVTAVRGQLGVVLQNSRLMGGSLWEIIAGGAIITIDRAWEAANMAGLAEDISQMPMQMHTVISEAGGNLSGGQRQRLLIARALVRSPKMLIFDEATSALDNRTQEIVTQSLESLGVTRIVVAHRESTIRMADRVYRL